MEKESEHRTSKLSTMAAEPWWRKPGKTRSTQALAADGTSGKAKESPGE